MNVKMIRHKNETEHLLLSITKNCETLIQPTHRKADNSEFKLTKPPISIEGSWMIGSTNLEVYNSVFNITEHNNKVELYTDIFNGFTFMEIKTSLKRFLILKRSHLNILKMKK